MHKCKRRHTKIRENRRVLRIGFDFHKTNHKLYIRWYKITLRFIKHIFPLSLRKACILRIDKRLWFYIFSLLLRLKKQKNKSSCISFCATWLISPANLQSAIFILCLSFCLMTYFVNSFYLFCDIAKYVFFILFESNICVPADSLRTCGVRLFLTITSQKGSNSGP